MKFAQREREEGRGGDTILSRQQRKREREQERERICTRERKERRGGIYVSLCAGKGGEAVGEGGTESVHSSGVC